MGGTITSETMIWARNGPYFSIGPLRFPLLLAALPSASRYGDLSTWTVNEEIAAFKKQKQRRLDQVLTRAEIDEGVLKAKIDMGGNDLQQEVDTEESIATAMQAFEDDIYFVFVNDEQCTSLDDVIYLSPDNWVMYLCSAALAEGYTNDDT